MMAVASETCPKGNRSEPVKNYNSTGLDWRLIARRTLSPANASCCQHKKAVLSVEYFADYLGSRVVLAILRLSHRFTTVSKFSLIKAQEAPRRRFRPDQVPFDSRTSIGLLPV